MIKEVGWMSYPIEGKLAPAMTLPASNGKKVSLRDYRGKKVVLYFYPKDNTPGCTQEACQFRDNLPEFDSRDAVILGVSPDNLKSHGRFIEKFNLPFLLLADEDHAVSEKYGVWQEKNMCGKKYMGVVRTTFIIDTQGKIARVFPKVKVNGHEKEVLEALDTIS